MSNQTKPAGPKHEFYRNKAGGGIYPAMTNPAGYEDKNPDDWEPATPEEVEHEKRKYAKAIAARNDARRAELRGETVTLDASAGTLIDAGSSAPAVVVAPVVEPVVAPVVDPVVPVVDTSAEITNGPVFPPVLDDGVASSSAEPIMPFSVG